MYNNSFIFFRKESLLSDDWNTLRVYACEGNVTMCKIASFCINSNEVTNLNLIANYSTAINNLDTKFDIVLADIMDCAIFGNRIIDTIADAKENILEKNKPTIVIPDQVYFLIFKVLSILIFFKLKIRKRLIIALTVLKFFEL